MKKENCFLLDTFISGDYLKLHLIRENGEKFYLYSRFYPKIHLKSSLNYVKNTGLKFKSVQKKNLFLNKNVDVWELYVPISRWDLFKKKFLFNENIEVFNIDISPIIQFYFENNIFPTCKVNVLYENRKLIKITPIDNPYSTDYALPPLKILGLRPVANGNIKFSKWEGIELSIDDKTLYFDSIDSNFLEYLKDTILKNDPDIIISIGGDSIIFPEIYRFSKKFKINLGMKFSFKKGVSFFSYGKVVYRDAITYINNIIHIDLSNSFFGKYCGLEGLIEVARLTSFPLQEAGRISPGSSISLMELKTAFKRNYLIPSTKANPEKFKTALQLLDVDKGGLFFLPPVGILKNVAELDFFSMYPSIISKFNISIDTFKCKCCKNISEKIKIPFTDYYFCKKKKGIIPETIEPLLEKRKKYKELLQNNYIEELDLRQEAIKWMLVTCFGYLGYKNAKFGCVEAHEATTAAGRFILLKAKEIAEELGFKLVYAITDSIYVQKKNAKEEDYKNLAKIISEKTEFTINLKGIYKFIKFLPATQNENKPVMNRFFGIYNNGRVKIRGLMCNRRDTPPFIKKFQEELLKHFDSPNKLEEIYKKYIQKLKDNDLQIKELAIKKRITKFPESYKHNTLNAIISKQIKNIHIGENILYVVTDEKNSLPEERAKISTFADSYDFSYYKKMLDKALKEIKIS